MGPGSSVLNAELRALLSLDSRGARAPVARAPQASSLGFGVMFFSDVSQDAGRRYDLVFAATDFADRHGFGAVWLPERHFNSFGGNYPAPAVLAAALAIRTRHVRLRAGSVVLPLHHPLEVVEAWSVVDNISSGRVDLGFASGWHPDDFVLSPGTYHDLRRVWHERIPVVRKLWRGERLRVRNGKGEDVEVQIYPRPVQPEIAVWLAASRSEESFVHAGSMGYNVLTMLAGADLAELGRRIGLYRAARRDHGFAEGEGTVSLMLHTLVNRDLRTVEEAVREPFRAYIKSALAGHMHAMPSDRAPAEAEIDRVVDYSYERYFKTGALFGAVADAKAFLAQARAVGVNEIACLLDFGVEHATVIDSLPYLAELREAVQSA